MPGSWLVAWATQPGPSQGLVPSLNITLILLAGGPLPKKPLVTGLSAYLCVWFDPLFFKSQLVTFQEF